MGDEKNLLNEVASGSYNASERPFDFVEADAKTALICETESTAREKIGRALKEMGYQITEAVAARDALKSMRFHVYDVVVVNENFEGAGQGNGVLIYLENLAMHTRRNIFVALISDKYRTMDNMAAFNRSVNIVINPKNMDDIGTIIKGGIADNTAFYHVFKETLKKTGRI